MPASSAFSEESSPVPMPAARAARYAVAVAALTLAAAVAARVGLSALYQATPSEMTFVPDPAHAGYETAVVVGDPAQRGVYAVQTRLPANIRIDPHTHGEPWRVATVLSGTLYYGTGATFDEQRLKALPPGSVIVEPKGAPHFALTRGEPVLLNIVGEGPAATVAVQRP